MASHLQASAEEVGCRPAAGSTASASEQAYQATIRPQAPEAAAATGLPSGWACSRREWLLWGWQPCPSRCWPARPAAMPRLSSGCPRPWACCGQRGAMARAPCPRPCCWPGPRRLLRTAPIRCGLAGPACQPHLDGANCASAQGSCTWHHVARLLGGQRHPGGVRALGPRQQGNLHRHAQPGVASAALGARSVLPCRLCACRR